MDKQSFNSIIANRSPLGPEMLDELKKLIRSYPCCQTARLLMAKAMHESGHADYRKALQLAAIYATDREQLYHFILKPSLEKVIEEIDPKNKTDASRESLEKLEQQIIQQAIASSAPDELAKKPAIYPAKPMKSPAGQQQKTEEKPHHHDSSSPRSFVSWLKTMDELPETHDSAQDGGTMQRDTPKAAFYSPVQMARLSLLEDESFITETLARIYIKQQHYEKAIKAYRHLSLKNPEKKTYFAAQIKKLENLINKDIS